MDQTRQKQLADILSRRYAQPERVALLSRLGVDPEACTLGAQTPEEVAWRMMRWFEDRGRLEELDQAARVGWSRRLVRRISLGTVATGMGVCVLLLGANLFDAQARVCRLPLSQPALADACGAWGLGGAPTQGERLAWGSRERGSCAALRRHLERFPHGAYRSEADARLTARRIAAEERWTPREQPLELHIPPEAPSRRVRAEAAVRARAQAEAVRLCSSFAATGQHRVQGVRVEEIRLSCQRIGASQVCSLDGQAHCSVEERGEVTRETCAEGGSS